MIKQEYYDLRGDLIHDLKQFCKLHNLCFYSKDFNEVVKKVYEYLESFSTDISNLDAGKPNLEERKVFSELHKEIVDKCIKTISENESIKKHINIVKQDLQNKYNDDSEVRIYLGIDNLDASFDDGNWNAATDSSMILTVGTKQILESI